MLFVFSLQKETPCWHAQVPSFRSRAVFESIKKVTALG